MTARYPRSTRNRSLSIDVCLLTGPTRGAIATVGVAGDSIHTLIGDLFSPATAGPYRIDQVRYGRWHGGAGSDSPPESVVVSFNPAPRGSCEIHCHGGAVAASRIIDDWVRIGARRVTPQRWLTLGRQGRFSINERIVSPQAIQTLTRTTSPRTAAIALDQVRGAMERFADESAARLAAAAGQTATVIAEIAQEASRILSFADLGRHLANPYHVVLAGPPNVGKSSLINAIVGYRRSITMDQPGTTRDVLDAQTVLDGWPVRLSDTAGIREHAESSIESFGIAATKRELATADLVLWVHDAARPLTHVRPPAAPPEFAGTRWLTVDNKIDLVAAPASPVSADRIATSATTGRGIETLTRRIVERLVPEIPPRGTAVPISSQQIETLRSLAAATTASTVSAALQALSADFHDVDDRTDDARDDRCRGDN